jgi:DNA-binding CsgD family transcriptional regulator
VNSRVAELERIWDLSRSIDAAPVSATLRARVLEPAAGLLGAETAVARVFVVSRPVPRLEGVDSLEIADSVHDAYRNRYFRLDPVHQVLNNRLSQPLFADPDRPGEWQRCQSDSSRGGRGLAAASGSASQRRRRFRQYFREFLAPNDFYHHLGFCFQDSSARFTFLLDFHRGQRSSPFSELDMARARILAALLHAKPARNVSVAERCESLSPREFDVAQAVASGLSNKEVGSVLGISVRTVENHLRSIFAKLKIKSRVRLAFRLREIDQRDSSP